MVKGNVAGSVYSIFETCLDAVNMCSHICGRKKDENLLDSICYSSKISNHHPYTISYVCVCVCFSLGRHQRSSDRWKKKTISCEVYSCIDYRFLPFFSWLACSQNAVHFIIKRWCMQMSRKVWSYQFLEIFFESQISKEG